jgi:hypothetical protein
MLGEKLGEGKGRITSRRVLPPTGGSPRMEVCFEATGRLLGVETKEVATYWSEIRGPGLFYGEGQGIVMGPDGESCTWRGGGVGHARGKSGAISFRGSIYYDAPPGSKFARVNGVAGVFEFDVDDSGNTEERLWEWK